jgi:hypothetical protein
MTQTKLSRSEVETTVRRSYVYVALYNTLNNFAVSETNPFATGGWNKTHYPEGLMDDSVRAIPRPNNDTLYVISMLDLRAEPVVIHYPEFHSKYVSLETSTFDHYVNIPLATSNGDFAKPTSLVFYSAQTEGYSGEPVEAIDRIIKLSGDFATAFLRVMPEAEDEARFKENMAAISKVKLQTFSEHLGDSRKPAIEVDFPAYGDDSAVFENNFLEVMQFVFNHTAFNRNDEMDKGVLAALAPLGVEPGKPYGADHVANIDGKLLAEVAEEVSQQEFTIWDNPRKAKSYLTKMFRPKGQMDFDTMVLQSAVGPLGQPADQAMYPAVTTSNGKPMNAQHDYAIRMTKDQMPPAKAFWSLTLYDAERGFFIPNNEKKYSVGENAGMRLDDTGGIEVRVAAEKPQGVPEENWLPIRRDDLDLDAVLRIYEPNLESMKTWEAPQAELRT